MTASTPPATCGSACSSRMPVHLSVKEDADGNRVTKETLIFPRYHQWEVVNTLIDTTRAEGPGKRYLIQHSAGSGKSNSIAWTAHQLASLYDAEGQRLFNSVIVITDRTVLDKRLQDTIYQFEHAQGVVKCITRDIGSQSKSEQLAEALAEQTRIIIVTIQTFPALFEALDKYPRLASGRYAVIADEAHSSQTGSSASKLKQILGSDAPDAEEISAEELLDAAVAARAPNERISYYAFTATPKAKTLELFGRPAIRHCRRAPTTSPRRSTCTPCARPSRKVSSSMCYRTTPPTAPPGRSPTRTATTRKWTRRRRA